MYLSNSLTESGLQCLGRGYGLNEASYFLVRLLQHFDEFKLHSESQPPESRPREEWKLKEGRQAKEQIWPAAAMTLFVKVSFEAAINDRSFELT